jgi:hypothetical protein
MCIYMLHTCSMCCIMQAAQPAARPPVAEKRPIAIVAPSDAASTSKPAAAPSAPTKPAASAGADSGAPAPAAATPQAPAATAATDAAPTAAPADPAPAIPAPPPAEDAEAKQRADETAAKARAEAVAKAEALRAEAEVAAKAEAKAKVRAWLLASYCLRLFISGDSRFHIVPPGHCYVLCGSLLQPFRFVDYLVRLWCKMSKCWVPFDMQAEQEAAKKAADEAAAKQKAEAEAAAKRLADEEAAAKAKVREHQAPCQHGSIASECIRQTRLLTLRARCHVRC